MASGGYCAAKVYSYEKAGLVLEISDEEAKYNYLRMKESMQLNIRC